MVEVVDVNDLSHTEARRAVSTGAPVYLFVNPVEFHGPHLPLHNDELVARGLARDLHARAFDDAGPLLVGGRLEMGVDPCPGPGTRAFSFDVVRDAVTDACDSLVDLGARKIVAMTFHGSPLHEHAIDVGLAAARKRGARALNPMNLLLDLLVTVDGRRFAPAVDHIDDAAERARLLELMPVDFHAGFFETSMTLHYAPASVSPAHAELPPCAGLPLDPVLARLERAARAIGRTRLADEFLLAARSQGWGSLRPFPGYTSSPHRATASTGAYFAGQIIDLYAPVVRGVLDGVRDAPPPVMPWVLWATLGGRVEAAKKVELHEVRA